MEDKWKYNRIKVTNPDVKYRHLPFPANINALIPIVNIDVVNGKPGTHYPLGTPASPVNNLVDAGIIAKNRGLPVIISGKLTDDTKETIKEQWKRMSGNIIEL